MTAQEFGEWEAFFLAEQLHPSAQRVRYARLLAAVHNGPVTRPGVSDLFTSADFLPADPWAEPVVFPQAPPDLAAGERVTLVRVPASGSAAGAAGAGGSSGSDSASTVWSGVVTAVEPVADAQGTEVVSVQLPAGQARLVAALPVVAWAMGSGAGGSPLGFLLGSPVGWACLAAGAGIGLVGLWWIEAIAHDVDAG